MKKASTASCVEAQGANTGPIGEDARPQTFSVQSVAATAAIPGETPRRAPLVEQTKGPGSLIDTSGAGADDASEAR
jgi:hypothetical protein